MRLERLRGHAVDQFARLELRLSKNLGITLADEQPGQRQNVVLSSHSDSLGQLLSFYFLLQSQMSLRHGCPRDVE